jgi:glycosyltransferase involved in cell wall biosynthesis
MEVGIVNIALATAHPHIPQITGGAQANMHEMALALQDEGHNVAVVAGLTGAGLLGLRARIALKLFRRSFHSNRALGYKTVRSWFPWVVAPDIVAELRPDVVVAQSGLPGHISRAFKEQGIPTVIHFHNVESDDLADVSGGSADSYIANSGFTARHVAKEYGIDARVIVPSFHRDRYETRRVGDKITFINPHPNKGVELLLEVVKLMPTQPFLFVKAWTLTPEDAAVLDDANVRLPNLTISEPVRDMREVYAQTKILVMPSKWEEAWGRVATEAQFSGIPVVGSNRGGIPEAIGPGGVIMDKNASPEQWVQVLSSLHGDHYQSLATAALAHSNRPEIDLHAQMLSFVSVCEEAVNIARSTSLKS